MAAATEGVWLQNCYEIWCGCFYTSTETKLTQDNLSRRPLVFIYTSQKKFCTKDFFGLVQPKPHKDEYTLICELSKWKSIIKCSQQHARVVEYQE